MSTTEETAETGHSFRTPVGSLPDPGQESRCAECGKTYRQHVADETIGHAVRLLLAAYGDAAPVSTDWCIAWGGEDANDCAGRLEYDDEAEARDMAQWIDGGIVARQTVIRLPWVTVPADEAGAVAKPCDCGPDDRCSDCTPPDELAAAIGTAVRAIINEGTDGPCCTDCGPGCECGGSPHGEAGR